MHNHTFSNIGIGSDCDFIAITSDCGVVPYRRSVSDGEVWAGSPAKFARKVTKEDVELIQSQSTDMSSLALLHAGENEKDYKTIAQDLEEYEDKLYRAEDYFQPKEDDADDVLGQGAPGRIFDTTLSEPEEGLKKN